MRKKPHNFGLSPEDQGVWAAYTQGVKPLKRQAKQTNLPQKPKVASVIGEKYVAPPPTALASETKKGPVTTLDRRSETRLKRGQWSIEGRLDLHGLTQDAAYRALARFIQHHYAQGSRCVLVITGKGSGQGTGILRRMVPHWLEESHLQPHILRITPAQPQHGGDGALYVLLRRQRSV